ncbi:MAG: hypothetical protein KDD25_09535 [Bdellovibrionales bacterium]|nr:hypothetical protein [Bdellovibrionales bacterium]
MRRVAPIFFTLLAFSAANASQIKCRESSTKNEILNVVDDLGTIVSGSIELDGESCLLQENENYFYWYGSTIAVTQKCGAKNVRVLASHLFGERQFHGLAVIYDDKLIETRKVTCQE